MVINPLQEGYSGPTVSSSYVWILHHDRYNVYIFL